LRQLVVVNLHHPEPWYPNVIPDSVKELVIAYSSRIGFSETSRDYLKGVEKLSIIENDANDLFYRLNNAAPEVKYRLKTLYLRTTNGFDLFESPNPRLAPIEAGTFDGFQLFCSLKALTLVLGTKYVYEGFENVWYNIPSSLETLHFRGSAHAIFVLDNIPKDGFKKWTEAMRKPEFLPNLKTFSFMLDMVATRSRKVYAAEYLTLDAKDISLNPDPLVINTRDYTLRDENQNRAFEACIPLLTAARDRGIKVEKFIDPYPDYWPDLAPIDKRWEEKFNLWLKESPGQLSDSVPPEVAS
jgi:hypothetical protein